MVTHLLRLGYEPIAHYDAIDLCLQGCVLVDRSGICVEIGRLLLRKLAQLVHRVGGPHKIVAPTTDALFTAALLNNDSGQAIGLSGRAEMEWVVLFRRRGILLSRLLN